MPVWLRDSPFVYPALVMFKDGKPCVGYVGVGLKPASDEPVRYQISSTEGWSFELVEARYLVYRI